MSPEPFSLQDHILRARQDAATLEKLARPLEGRLTLTEALARGLTDNLDHKLSVMEKTINQYRLDVMQYDMLPKVAAEAGYSWRDKESASSSISLLSRRESLEPSYSSEPSGRTAELNFSWNILDFGMGYFRAKQQADNVLVAVEMRRRVINNTAKQIISAYYRAASAERLLPQVESSLESAERALKASEDIQKRQLVPAAQTLTYRRDVLQNVMKLRSHRQNLLAAKQELAALINMPLTADVTLSMPPQKQLPKLDADIATIQQFGLVNRSELREEAYKQRIERNNLNQEILQFFPGLSAIGSLNYDSNKYLYYNDWSQLGARAAWNLINVIKAPQTYKLAKSQIEYAEMRRLAMSTAILAQIAISYHQYEVSRSDFTMTDKLSKIESDLLKVSRDAKAADSGSTLDVIRQEVATLTAQMDKDRVYADAQTALVGLMISAGYDLLPATLENTDPQKLRDQIGDVLQSLQSGKPLALGLIEPIFAQEQTGQDSILRDPNAAYIPPAKPAAKAADKVPAQKAIPQKTEAKPVEQKPPVEAKKQAAPAPTAKAEQPKPAEPVKAAAPEVTTKEVVPEQAPQTILKAAPKAATAETPKAPEPVKVTAPEKPPVEAPKPAPAAAPKAPTAPTTAPAQTSEVKPLPKPAPVTPWRRSTNIDTSGMTETERLVHSPEFQPSSKTTN